MDLLLTPDEVDVLYLLLRSILDRRLVNQYNIDDLVPIRLSTTETMILEDLYTDLYLGGAAGAHVRAGATQSTQKAKRMAESPPRRRGPQREEWKPPLPKSFRLLHGRKRLEDD